MDALLAKKKRQGLWRRHPELPEMDSAVQYSILVDTSKIKREIRIREQRLKVTGELGKEAAKAVRDGFESDFKNDVVLALDGFDEPQQPSKPAKPEPEQRKPDSRRAKDDKKKRAADADDDGNDDDDPPGPKKKKHKSSLAKAREFRSQLLKDIDRFEIVSRDLSKRVPDMKTTAAAMADIISGLQQDAPESRSKSQVISG